MLAIDHILSLLQQHPTEAILLASQTQLPAIHDFATQHQRQLTWITPDNNAESLPHQAFAIIVDFLEHMKKDQALHLLGQWRNLRCNHMWIAVSASDQRWTFQDFIGLGCKRLGQYHGLSETCGDSPKDTPTIKAYGYDLGHYNQRRRWNSPRYWANPDMWSKRW